jgi:hypothetical protein
MTSDLDSIEVTTPRSSRQITKTYNSTQASHKIVARVLSTFFESSAVRVAFNQVVSESGNETVLLGSFLFDVVLKNDLLSLALDESLENEPSVDRCELFTVYLQEYPGLEGAFMNPNDTTFLNIIEEDFQFSVVSVFSDVDTYAVHRSGVEIAPYDVGDEPGGVNIFKLTINDHYLLYRRM